MLSSIIATLGSSWIGIIIIVLLLVIALTRPQIDFNNKSIKFRENKRSCRDCFDLLQGMRTSFEISYNLKLNSILRLQMIYAEQKLEEIAVSIRNPIHYSVKDEIRRSFKENGFCEMDESQYNRYLDGRYDYFNIALNNMNEDIKLIIKDIYDNAKSVKIRIENEIKQLEEDFHKKVNEMVGL